MATAVILPKVDMDQETGAISEWHVQDGEQVEQGKSILTIEGYQVTVFEKLPVLGGMLTVGIPSYRLPKDIINAEIQVMRDMGVEFKTGVEIGKDFTISQLRDQGYKGTIYQTHGIATDDFIRLGGAKVEGTILAAGPMLVIDEIPASNPTKQVALAYIATYERQFGSRPATFGANTWDAGLLLERAIPAALKVAKPGTEAFRVTLRDALEHEREVVGCQGVFNMSPTNHNGMDERARVLVTIRDGRFRRLAE